MSILDEIRNEEVWQDFLHEKSRRGQLSRKEETELAAFIRDKSLVPLAETLAFDYPVKKQIAKGGSDRKRTVYLYSRAETWVLKLIAWLLCRYDDRMSDHCYSFRRGKTVKSAFRDLRSLEDLDARCVLKADIRNYFNSIDPAILCKQLREFLADDPELAAFLAALLTQNRCYENGELKEEMRGAMAGMPLSSFFANLYLLELDRKFEALKIPCFRYSDDILILASSGEERDRALEILEAYLSSMHLSLNPEKVNFYEPHQGWEFLGLSYREGEIDLSRHSIRKIKQKIRRKARKLYAWRKKTGGNYDRAAQRMIRSMDNIFYDLFGNGNFTWTRFCFPLITKTDGLHEIDEYFLLCLRYLYSGRFTKKNYRITYDHLRSLGYTPLKAEYYRWKKENRILSAQ